MSEFVSAYKVFELLVGTQTEVANSDNISSGMLQVAHRGRILYLSLLTSLILD